MRFVGCRWIVVCAASLLAGCGGGKGKPADGGGLASSPPSTQAAAEEEGDSPGRTLYRRACVMCHGERGAGTAIGPALNDRPRELAAIEAAVRDGVEHVTEPHTPMPPRGDGTYTDAQIRTVAEYVRSLASGK
jgi:mono/diheme cytochrome c family protein